jgi:hypothetical protein
LLLLDRQSVEPLQGHAACQSEVQLRPIPAAAKPKLHDLPILEMLDGAHAWDDDFGCIKG